jgi:hypothetical protein
VEKLSSHTPKGEHLFISYAWEDGALAEWLSLKLTALGYRVWCDRFKLLGGESYPRDIDAAIKDSTFRLLALLSKSSLAKPNPVKERTLALHIGNERKIDFLIPLNVDGLRPTELDWMTSDLTFIPFQSWSEGLSQLLKKLAQIGTPKPLTEGNAEAIRASLPPAVTITAREDLISNWFQFDRVPEEIQLLTVNKSLPRRLLGRWAFSEIRPTLVAAFDFPPDDILDEFEVVEMRGLRWADVEQIEGISAANLATTLVRKSLEVALRSSGLKYSNGTIYFPSGLLEKDRLSYRSEDGRPRSVLISGQRKSSTGQFRYHLAPSFVVRREDGLFVARLVIRLHLTDSTRGVPLRPRTILARRKKIGKSWWNDQWLSRQQAICSFLRGSHEVLAVGREEARTVALRLSPLRGSVEIRINEQVLRSMKDSIGFEEAATGAE